MPIISRKTWCRAPLSALACSLAMGGLAQAQSIAAIGTEGVSFIAPGGDLYATYEGSGAGYFNQLFLADSNTPILSNKTTSDGYQTLLGNFAAGTELVFRMNSVTHDGAVYDFYSGGAINNVDGLAHARVQYGWRDGATLVSFEDQAGNPEGDGGFNDLSFSLRSQWVTPPPDQWPSEPPIESPFEPPVEPPVEPPFEPPVEQPWPDFIAPIGTEGLSVIAPGGDLFATYVGSDAGYTNELFVNGVAASILSNKTTQPGTEVWLGSFAAGTEVVFRMNVIDHDGLVYDYFTGEASRNADGLAHARVHTGWKDGATLVSFEDMQGNPEGDAGFNDLSFSLSSAGINPIPEPGTLPLMALGLGGLLMAHRKRQKA
jgi:PEP-CTERM motif